MRLMPDIARLIPVEFIPIYFTKPMVRSLLSARSNKKSTMHNIASQTLNNILKTIDG